jgi:hypothetical protein
MRPHSPFAAGLIAVGNVVAVARVTDWERGRIVPRARRVRCDPPPRLQIGVAIARSQRGQVLAEVDLDRRLAVAEQVVGSGHTRGDVLPMDLVG